MRKLTLLAVAFLTAQLGFSQKGIELGVEFTPAATLILNDEDFAAGDDLNFQGTFGFNTGLSVGYNFNDGLGLVSGIIFSQQGQNYVTAFDGVAKGDQDVFNRTLSYVRLPLLLKINSDPSASSGTYFRFGPHFDFLTGAKYSYDSKGTVPNILYDTNGEISLLTDPDYKDLNIYNKFVFGITLEFGGSANINENMKITFMLSLSGNLNSEGDQVVDAANGALGRQPLKYKLDSSNNARSAAYNVMGGLNVGFRYTIPMN
jgi:hypothetical protein